MAGDGSGVSEEHWTGEVFLRHEEIFHAIHELEWPYGVEQHEFRSFEPPTGMLELTWRFYERVGENLEHRTDSCVKMRLLTPHEAGSLLEFAGWKVEAAYGGWGREPVSAERRKLVIVARPAARG